MYAFLEFVSENEYRKTLISKQMQMAWNNDNMENACGALRNPTS